MSCEIGMFFHCRKCIAELPKGESPESFARLSVGWTPKGVQVWCVRHQSNIMNLDFQGQQVAIVISAETIDATKH